MASIRSATDSLAEAKSHLLILLQENDRHDGFATETWSDEIYQAIVSIENAQTHIDQAELS